MIHYHGTPIGGTRAAAEEFASDRFLLVPWKRPEDLRRAMEFSRGFVVDNSAFSFWRTGEQPDWSQYITWVMSICNHPRFHWAIIPDVIDGDESQNDYLIDWWQRVAKGVPCCPVWHLHESITRLQHLAMTHERVAFGSSGQWPNPGVGSWWERMDEAFKAITDKSGYPICKVHGLRMLRKEIVERYPLASADSTNAAQNGSVMAASIKTDDAWGRMTLARRIEMARSPCSFVASDTQQLFELEG